MVTMETDFLFFLGETIFRLENVNIPSTNVLVTALMTLLARSLRPNDALSCSTETIREPDIFFLISTSVVGCQEENNEVKQTYQCITKYMGVVRRMLVRSRHILFGLPFLFECIKAETCWALTGEKVGQRLMGFAFTLT